MIIIFVILAIFILWIIIGNLCRKGGNSFDVYFGVPGSGKTTFAAYLAKKRLKKRGRVLSNVNIKGTYEVKKDDIGQYMIKNCLLLIDEAGVDYNNRNYKKFDDDSTYFFKYHRHYNVDIAIFCLFLQEVFLWLLFEPLSGLFSSFYSSHSPLCSL